MTNKHLLEKDFTNEDSSLFKEISFNEYENCRTNSPYADPLNPALFIL